MKGKTVHTTLPRDVATRDDLDFSFLREKGIEYIEQLAGALWSDYNTHDPGITILEMLAYAITDLSARMEMPMEDLLASANNSSLGLGDQFFTAPQILPSNPVTEADYRKLIIDIKGVQNCWIKPFQKIVHVDHTHNRLSYNEHDFSDIDPAFKSHFPLKGLYSIIVDLDSINGDAEKERIFNEISAAYHDHRNLCEDLVDITEVEGYPIKICAQIEIAPEANEEWVHAQVLRAIDHYFSPPIRFYSFKEMLEKGYATDEIFEGPLLQNGFIDPDELDAATLREEIRLSDIMHLIMNIKGVKVIKDITMDDGRKSSDAPHPWIIPVEEGKKPLRNNQSAFSYFKDVLPVNVNAQKVQEYLLEMKLAEEKERAWVQGDLEPNLPKGVYRNTGETTTIQNDFPDTYGIGQNGLPSHTTARRKTQALQLKGYLLFFDQLLASYFAQLEGVKTMLSAKNRGRRTYFTRAVKDLKGLSALVKDYPMSSDEELSDALFGNFDNQVDRNSKIVDHLLARFAETFSDYAFLMKQLYGLQSEGIVLNTKEKFLEEYAVSSRRRGNSFTYPRQPESRLWNTDNVSGVVKRLGLLMGFDPKRRNLSEGPVELYEFNDSDGNRVFRWRIRNLENKIILTATENYRSPQRAEQELGKSVLKAIETTVEAIEKVFMEGVVSLPDETIVENLQIQVSEKGKYSFNVINREADPTSSHWVISRHYIYYGSTTTLKQAMLDFVNFFTYSFSEEGMHLVENILLRPDVTSSGISHDQFMPICMGEASDCQPVDPYSYRVTVILPGWSYRFSNIDFRRYLERRIREELPAHVLARVCWVGYRKGYPTENENDMEAFEEAYRDFLFAKTDLGQEQDEAKLLRLTHTMGRLNSIYPQGKLLDCSDEEEELKGRIILGRTNIGNI